MTDDYDSFKLISCKIFILMHSWLWLVSKQSGTEHGNCKFTWNSHIFTQLFMVYWWAAGITLKWIKITHTFVWFASCVAMNQAENIFLFRQHTHTHKQMSELKIQAKERLHKSDWAWLCIKMSLWQIRSEPIMTELRRHENKKWQGTPAVFRLAQRKHEWTEHPLWEEHLHAQYAEKKQLPV